MSLRLSQQITSHKSGQAPDALGGSRRKRSRKELAPPVQPPRPRTHTAAEPKEERPKPAPKRYREYEPGHYLIRQIERSYQARGWVTNLGSVNLGLYRGEDWQDNVVGERKAARVSAEYKRRWRMPGGCPVAVFFAMRREGKIRSDVLAPGVVKVAGGFVGRKYTPVGSVHLPTIFPDQESCAFAVLAEVNRLAQNSVAS